MDLHLAIRWLHVAAMAVALGGAVLVLAMTVRRIRGALADAAIVQIAAVYEWVFWAAAGTLAMTGVGNLGAFGVALPNAQTSWGTTFIVKLTLVLGLVVLSLPRSIGIAKLVAGALPARGVIATVRILYGATIGGVAAILGLAILLAHG